MTFTASTYEAIAEGVYPGKLVSIEEQPGETFGAFLIWNFQITESDGTTSNLSGASSKATGPKSKGYKWATALLGHPPNAGVAESIEGLACQLHVVINEEGFNRIEAVLPASKSATAPAVVFDDSPPARLEPVKSVEVPF